MWHPKHILISWIFLAGCNWSSTDTSKKQPVDGTQSVIWLVCEDQSLFLPIYGDSTALMPNLCSLADDGTIYDNFFAVAPVCAPSRSSIITGVQPALMGTQHMRAFQANKVGLNQHTGLPFYSAPAPPGTRSFTEYLREAGVFCTNNSKEDYNFETPPLAWDESSSDAHWRERSDGQPFFSVFNFNVTHESQIWKRQETSCQISHDSVPVPLLIPRENAVRKDIAVNYCNLEELDRQIGKVIDELKEDGLYESTTVVFFSDHGGPFPRFKRSPTDAGLRVPLVIKWGHVKDVPSRNAGLFSFLDLAPSVLRWFNVQREISLSGMPILPDSRGHEAVYASTDRLDEHLNRRRTIRTTNWRLIRNDFQDRPAGINIAYRKQMNTMKVIDSLAQDGIEPWISWKSKPLSKWELYNSSEDEWELENLHLNPLFADTLVYLQNLLFHAFPPGQDLGNFDEKKLIESFKQKVASEELTLPTLTQKGRSFIISHENPNVSIGWRTKREDAWNVASRGAEINIAEGITEVEVLVTRIGWKSKTQVLNIIN